MLIVKAALCVEKRMPASAETDRHDMGIRDHQRVGGGPGCAHIDILPKSYKI